MPDTLEAVTGSRGRRFDFQHPGVTVPNMVGLLPGIDARGDGGLVVAPPSIHVSGNHYFWDGMDGLESEIAAAPAWLLEIIMGKHPAGENKRAFSAISISRRRASATSFLRLASFADTWAALWAFAQIRHPHPVNGVNPGAGRTPAARGPAGPRIFWPLAAARGTIARLP